MINPVKEFDFFDIHAFLNKKKSMYVNEKYLQQMRFFYL